MEKKHEIAFITAVGEVTRAQSEMPLLDFILERYDSGALNAAELKDIMGFYAMVAGIYGRTERESKSVYLPDNNYVGETAAAILIKSRNIK